MSLSHDRHDFKLETSFETNPRCIVHTAHESDPELEIRKVVVQERWVPRKPESGFGLFGPVRLEEQLDPSPDCARVQRAVKVLHKQRMKRRNFDYRKELLALAKFSRSKFVLYYVEFLGWFEDDNRIYLAMENLPLGTLKTFINDDLKECDAQVISVQLLEGLKIMHEEGFTHRDLKPENIFVVQSAQKWWVKIGGFESVNEPRTTIPRCSQQQGHHHIGHRKLSTSSSRDMRILTNILMRWIYGPSGV
ncbi:hypothetical protein ONS96_009869 [Cadophora gregata f. sp. sojae]|nr:hypothetical protein ONS96_009869 [Cadophora gregata f. sp. sojae]